MTENIRTAKVQKKTDASNTPDAYEVFRMEEKCDELFIRYQKLKMKHDNLMRKVNEIKGEMTKFDEYSVDDSDIALYYKGEIVEVLDTQETIEHMLGPWSEYVPYWED